jgi:hypothetical protein
MTSAFYVAGGGGEGRGPGRGTLQDVGQRLLQRGREQEEGRQGQGRGEEFFFKTVLFTKQQCWGSVTFLCGSGSGFWIRTTDLFD